MDLLSQLLDFLKGFGSMDNPHKVAGAIMLLISIWKSSLVRPMWDKLGGFQVLVAPVLGIALAMAQLPGGFSWANIVAGSTTGLLAIAMHEMMTAIENLPMVGAKYKSMVAWVDSLLFRPAAPPAA
jgi:hypothetical protein